MANYNKSFNFRNGLQVDDNFIINENGLVGIGTSVPTEILDVHGNIKVSGKVIANNIDLNNLNITGISSYNILNIGITTISSGIISATTGIITYYGDGSKLLNIPTSSWSFGVNGIYSNNNVGILTTNPSFSFQVGLNPLLYSGGIGINSNGNVYSNGIVTAASFIGNGSNLSSLSASNITSGTLSTSFFPSSIRLSGIITAAAFSGSGAGLTSINASNVSSGTLSTSVFPSNIRISGVITASNFVGNLSGTATTASSLVSTGSISISSINAGVASIGVATVTNSLYVIGYPAKIGVGTNTEPQSDIEVKKSGISSISVISNNNIAFIGIGTRGKIRTGNTDNYYLYSTTNSLDIINENTGNVNTYLNYGLPGVGTGNFNWIYGQIPYYPLMTLTYNGNLGLGITNPTTKLYVVGSSYLAGITTIDSILTVKNNLYVNGDANFDKSINSPVINADNVDVTGIVTASGFTSGSNPVSITVSGNVLTFTVPGVGSTSLTLS
jgi:hypothetical protein